MLQVDSLIYKYISIFSQSLLKNISFEMESILSTAHVSHELKTISFGVT